MNNEEYVAKHPELYLPMTKEANLPRVVDMIKSRPNISESEVNEFFLQAINIHLTKTYYEISELCEYGSSDNYFIYENLITHIKNSNFTANTQNMSILLKTTVFSNLALINSLQKQKEKVGRSIATSSNEGSIYSTDLMNKMNVNWANEYYKSLRN